MLVFIVFGVLGVLLFAVYKPVLGSLCWLIALLGLVAAL
jgi:uncharacterized MAPEG superfamily protein